MWKQLNRSFNETPTYSDPPYDDDSNEEDGGAAHVALSKMRAARGSTARIQASIHQRKLKWVSKAKFTYESLDFHDVENDLLRENREKHLSSKATITAKQQAVKYVKIWFLLSLIGILTGTCAFLIDKGISEITKYKWRWVGDYMETDPTDPGTVPFGKPYAIFLAMNMTLAFISSLFVVFVEPLAAGSGIPEVKCYLNGIRVYHVVRFRTLIAKAVGILFSVASGLPCGKEGPMIHSGAIIGGGVATGKSSKLNFDTGFFKEYRGDRDKNLFVTAGAAAGVAAAFGAPVGGVLFAVEEVGSFWNLEMSVMVFCSSAFSVLIMNIYYKFQDPLDPASGLTDFGVVQGKYEVWELPLCMVLGALGGLLGAAFNALNLKITKWRSIYIKKIKYRQILQVLVVNFLVSTILFILTSRFYQCDPDPNAAFTDADPDDTVLRHYGCNQTAGEYNNMATLYFSQTESNIRHMLHFKGSIDYNTLFLHLVPYFFLTVMTYGIQVPSGLFLPGLALGATVGRIFGQLVSDSTNADLSYGSYAAFGAAGVLAGMVRMTVSLSVIVMEATGNATLVIPLMIVTCTAKVVGDLFNHGIYDEHIHFNGVPLMERELEDDRLDLATAEEVMNEVDLAVIRTRPTVNEVLDILKQKPYHQGFIITDGGTLNEPLRGLVLRRYLMIILRKGAWGECPDLQFEDFMKSALERVIMKPQTYALTLSSKDLTQRINLARYMDKHPFTVLRTTPLPRVYTIFRELGLRHLVVTDNNNHPAGLIARKCLVHLEDASLFDTDLRDDARFAIPRHPSVEDFPSNMDIQSGSAAPSNEGLISSSTAQQYESEDDGKSGLTSAIVKAKSYDTSKKNDSE